MTDFKRHNGVGLKITDAWVKPKYQEDGPDLADKVVLDTEKHGEVSYKARYVEETSKMVEGLKVKDEVERRYSINQLPSDVQELVRKAQDEDITVTVNLGEAINDGDSSYYIPKGEFDTIQQQETLFDGDDDGEDQDGVIQ
ncbi:MAG: hypothetical protein ABEK04_03440 [Candidatus Nanohalobium sp.]